MRIFTAQTTVPCSPDEVLHWLTEPSEIARWAPVPFEILELDGGRLEPGSSARVQGQLAGQRVEFAVNVIDLSDRRLALAAEGPISLDVEYTVRGSVRGSGIRASISVKGNGLLGRLLASATEALLAAGALQSALNRMFLTA